MAGGGAAPQPKQDEHQPHPVKDQLPNVSFCITSPPPWPEAILLGFQHYLVMLGTTVLIPNSLVPQMVDLPLFLFSVFVISSPFFTWFVTNVQKFERIMRGTQGALIVASILQIVLSFSGLWRNVVRFLSPLSAVPLVALSGFGLY